ncbi:MAG: hypothetical protein MZV63_33805 [Marinilabiliales bacterium]|nr:hypothetical protein [Marinilabiliales bacterium]
MDGSTIYETGRHWKNAYDVTRSIDEEYLGVGVPPGKLLLGVPGMITTGRLKAAHARQLQRKRNLAHV